MWETEKKHKHIILSIFLVLLIIASLAGLYYGYEAVPEDWKTALKKRDYLEKFCLRADQAFPI